MSSFRGHWLPGDPRGFRSRRHRVHSSHDYKAINPQPEHEGLYAYASGLSVGKIRLTRNQSRIAVAAMVEKFAEMEIPLAAIACDAVHCHALIRAEDQDATKLFGRVKQAASHRLRAELPGKIWGASSHVERVHGLERFTRTVLYIWRHGDRGAIVWVRADIGAACLKRNVESKPDPSLRSRTRSDSASS